MTEPKVLDLMVSRLPASETSFANLPDVEVCFTRRHTNALNVILKMWYYVWFCDSDKPMSISILAWSELPISNDYSYIVLECSYTF